jgi:menaquinone-9 beta-reductase
MAREFDVAVVGASVAGCTVARLFAQRGARVALIERHQDPAAYKVACTHAILPPATTVIERLGLAPLLAERGVPRPWAQFWTPFGGWFGMPERPDIWGVTRRTLDPLLRDLAANTPGVEFLPGRSAKRVLYDRARPAGVEVSDRARETTAIRALLFVGADGRSSTVARLAGVRGRVRPHNRFFYFAYWRGIDGADPPVDRLWLLDPDAAAQFANEDGLTVLVAAWHRDRRAEVRADPERAYRRHLESLPDGPDLGGAEQVSKLIGKLDLPNVMRPAAAPGIAFVGDAALATDPLFGVGIAFAFQSAEWLVDATSGALGDERALDGALRRYRRAFAWRLGPHHFQIADFATGRPATLLERRLMRAAAGDPEVGRVFLEVLARERSPLQLIDPRVAARMVVA